MTSINPAPAHKIDFHPAIIIDKKDLPKGASKTALAFGAWADNYLSFASHKQLYKDGQIHPIKVNGHAWKTALKVMSFVLTLLILPGIAFIAKIQYKKFCRENLPMKNDQGQNQDKPEQKPSLTPRPETPQTLTSFPEPLSEEVKPTFKSKQADPEIFSYEIGNTHISLTKGDITQEKAEVLVNAANQWLQSGAGVCGAFANTAGRIIFSECEEIKEKKLSKAKAIPVGAAVLTTAGQLKHEPVKAIIHAVGPHGSDNNRQQLLINAIENSLKLGAGLDVDQNYVSDRLPANAKYRSIAFPAISTGIFGYPLEEAAAVIAETVIHFIQKNPDAYDKVSFVFLFSDDPNVQANIDKTGSNRKTAEAFFLAFNKAYDALVVQKENKQPIEKMGEKKEASLEFQMVYAADNLNQFKVNSKAACTLFACKFVESKQPANRENLRNLLKDNARPGEENNIPAEDAIKLCKDIESYRQTPLAINKYGLVLLEDTNNIQEMDNDSIHVDNDDDAINNFLQFVLKGLQQNQMNGCILSNGAETIALRMFENRIEFFDSHGPRELLSNGERPAYVASYALTDEKELMGKLLKQITTKFPVVELDDGFAIPEVITAYPLKFK